jgi:hypothetical protein
VKDHPDLEQGFAAHRQAVVSGITSATNLKSSSKLG